jgi:hypothetical protein
VENKGWSSFNEVMSNKLYSIETKISKIEIGDTLRLLGGNAKIVGSKKIEGLTMVYNLQDVKNNPNFFANNILVHNRFQPKI